MAAYEEAKGLDKTTFNPVVADHIERVVSLDPEVKDRMDHDMNKEILDSAKAGTQRQQNMSIREAFKKYPKAAMWSMIFSTAIVMEGYDLVMINSFYAQPQFNQFFGHYDETLKAYTLTPAWQAGLSNAVQVGSIIGLFLNGWLTDKLGYKKVMLASLILMTGFIFLTFFAQNLAMLLAGELLCGIPWGVFQTLTTAYASEVAPTPLRPFLTTYVNLCWVFGQFVASGVLRGFLNVEGNWAWKGPFAVQWVWPPIIFVCVLFAPESPWWLVRKERLTEAKAALRRFASEDETDADIDDTVAMIAHTNALEKSINASTSYLECFKGVDLRRTEIACIVWLIQAWGGGALMGQSTYFYEQAGLKTANAFDLSLGQYAIGAIGTMLSWFVMARVGRRTLYLGGMLFAEVVLILVGGLAFAKASSGRNWAIGSMLLIFTFVYDFTVGPVCYCLVAEMSSTRLRAKSIVLARNLYNVGGIVNNVIVPRMLNPSSSWHIGAKSGFYFAAINAVLLVWTWFRLPEPMGRTFGEMDILFENRVPARKFATTAADQYGSHGSNMTAEERALAELYEKQGGAGGH